VHDKHYEYRKVKTTYILERRPVGHDIAASKMRPSQSYYMESLFRERKRLHIDPSKEEKAAYMQGDEEEMPGMKPC